MIPNLFEVKMSHSSADDGLDFGALLTCPMLNLCKAKLFTNVFTKLLLKPQNLLIIAYLITKQEKSCIYRTSRFIS